MEILVAGKLTLAWHLILQVVVANGTTERAVHVQLALSEVYSPDLHIFSAPITLTLTIVISPMHTD